MNITENNLLKLANYRRKLYFHPRLKYIETMNAHVMLREAARTASLNAFLDTCF